MALKIVWTSQAVNGLEKVLDYLDKHWSSKEIISLEKNLNDLLSRISKFPEICPATSYLKDVRKGLVDRNNYIIYRIRTENNLIEIINFRGAKQNYTQS